jgi:hypothetical protein
MLRSPETNEIVRTAGKAHEPLARGAGIAVKDRNGQAIEASGLGGPLITSRQIIFASDHAD